MEVSKQRSLCIHYLENYFIIFYASYFTRLPTTLLYILIQFSSDKSIPRTFKEKSIIKIILCIFCTVNIVCLLLNNAKSNNFILHRFSVLTTISVIINVQHNTQTLEEKLAFICSYRNTHLRTDYFPLEGGSYIGRQKLLYRHAMVFFSKSSD